MKLYGIAAKIPSPSNVYAFSEYFEVNEGALQLEASQARFIRSGRYKGKAAKMAMRAWLAQGRGCGFTILHDVPGHQARKKDPCYFYLS